MTDRQRAELLGCPFCACAGEERRHAPSYPYFVEKVYVICRGCQIQTPLCDALDHAIALWNTRATAPHPQAEWVQKAAEEIAGWYSIPMPTEPGGTTFTTRRNHAVDTIAAILSRHAGRTFGEDDATVERVARAICIEERLDPDEDWRKVPLPSGDFVMLAVAIEPGEEQRWRTYIRRARAAIRALAEGEGK